MYYGIEEKTIDRFKLQLYRRSETLPLDFRCLPGAAGPDTGDESVEKRQSTHDRPEYTE